MTEAMDAPKPIGRYASFLDLCDEFDLANLAEWSNIDGTGWRDDRQIQKAMDEADAEIMAAFIGVGNYTMPLTPYRFDSVRVRRWAVKLAGCWLCLSRGVDRDTDERQTYEKLQRSVRDEIAVAKSDGGQIDAIRKLGFQLRLVRDD